MPSPDDARTLQAALKDLVTLLIRDLEKLWRLIQGRDLDAVQTRDMLIVASPDLVNPYASAAAKLTATWYDQLVPGSTYRAVTASLPASEQLAASARWAVGPLFGPRPVVDDPLARLAGSMQRRVFDGSRQTTLLNAEAEPGTRWARYASVTACEFCRLLATRTEDDLYLTERSSVRVVGRNGRPRGKQKLGDKFHDHCRCLPIAVRRGDTYEPPDYVRGWNDEYEAARDSTNGSIKEIMAMMRQNNI